MLTIQKKAIQIFILGGKKNEILKRYSVQISKWLKEKVEPISTFLLLFNYLKC